MSGRSKKTLDAFADRICPVVDASFAELVRQRRRELGVTQAALATDLRLSQSAVSRLERAQLPAHGVSLQSFSKALQMDTWRFFPAREAAAESNGGDQ